MVVTVLERFVTVEAIDELLVVTVVFTLLMLELKYEPLLFKADVRLFMLIAADWLFVVIVLLRLVTLDAAD